MTDVLMLAIVSAFFLLAGALVVGCDRVVGGDDDLGPGDAPSESDASGADEATGARRGVVR